MKLTIDLELFYEDLFKWPQLDFSFQYSYEQKYEHTEQTSVLEFGTGQGNSTKKICDLLKFHCVTRTPVHTFDSFQGLPKEKDKVPIFEKFKEGAYKFNITEEEIKKKCDYEDLFIHRTQFDKISDGIDVGKPFLIHIDCDIYQSTYEALDWCFRNKLIKKNTLIAFDEYRTQFLPLIGEELAFYEIVQRKYKAKVNEIFHYTYKDKDLGNEIRQNVFEIVGFNK